MSRWRFPFRGEPLSLDETTREGLPGSFVKLPDGVVHYEMAGPPDGPVVVLIHGFSVPYYIWDPTFGALADAGLRVLRYDLYGRGYSDRPDVVYDEEIFDRQLLHLLPALDVGEPVAPIGLSMGGPIAVLFAERHPEMVRKLCLIDPAGFPMRVSATAKLIFAPILGELVLSLFGDQLLVAGLANDLYRPANHPEYMEQYRAQMRYKGFKRAILSTGRHMPMGEMAASYERVGRQGRPVLLIWGREDRTLPFETHKRVLQAIPNAEFHAIEEAGHIPHYERPEAVNPLLIEFLGE